MYSEHINEIVSVLNDSLNNANIDVQVQAARVRSCRDVVRSRPR